MYTVSTKRYFLMVALLVIVFLPTLGICKPLHPYGPEAKRLGAGIFLGEPSGLTLKGYLSQRAALDGYASWSAIDGALLFMGDFTFDFFDIPAESTSVTFPFYAGAGMKVGFDKRGKHDGETIVGIRVPVGVAAQWTRYPVEAFLEVVPGLELNPETEADIMGGIGVRYYFW